MDNTVGFVIDNENYNLNVLGIEYVKDGFDIHFKAKNKQDTPISNISFKFELEDSKYEKEVNRLGYGHYVNINGYVYKDEEIEGYYHFNYNREIKIISISEKIIFSD